MENKKYFDWQAAANNIDLRDYISFKFPNFFISRKSLMSTNSDSVDFVDHENPSLRTDKYCVYKKDGKYLYISRRTEKKGSFIDFIKNEVVKGNRDWKDVINEELEKYYPVQYQIREKNKHFPERISLTTNKGDFDLNGKLYPIFKGSLEYITDFRKLSLNTVNSSVFKDVVKTYIANGRKSYFIGIPLINMREEMVGLNRIFTYKESDLFNEKRFLKGSDNLNGFSKSNTLKNTEKFILCEGVWDGMAHYELNQPKNVEYIFSNGELGTNKANNILKYIEERGIKSIELANDNDLRGNFFNLTFLSLLIPNLKFKSEGSSILTISIIDGDNIIQSKINEMFSYFLNKNNELINTIKMNNGNEAMLKQSDLFIYNKKEDLNEIEISLPNQKHFITDFNDFVIQMFSHPFEISISKSVGKDFNDDLKVIKLSEFKNDKEISVENTSENENQISR